MRRGNATERAVPYLARLVDSLPEPCGVVAEAEYLALLDRALLDRFLSVREQAGLVAAAGELGVDQATAVGLHRSYLAALARAALADGVVTAGERDDLDAVARLLDLDPCEVDAALEGSSGGCGRTEGAGFWLDPGDMVVFTGEMSVPRPVWEKRAVAAGLVPRSAVTKKVKLVVAAGPDSLSGKGAQGSGLRHPDRHRGGVRGDAGEAGTLLSKVGRRTSWRPLLSRGEGEPCAGGGCPVNRSAMNSGACSGS